MLISPFLIRHNKRIARLSCCARAGRLQTGLGAHRGREPGARAARARDPLRLRPRRPERRPRAGERGLRIPRDGPRPGARAHRARRGRRRDLRRRRGRRHAAVGRPRPRERRRRHLLGPDRSLPIVRAVRRLRKELPILVRAADDTHLEELLAAGATEVVPETLEAALTLVSNTLHMLQCAGLAGDPGGRRNPRPALQDAALGASPRRRRPRPTIRHVPRGAAHGRAAAGRLVHRPDASAKCAAAARKCRSRPCGATASSGAIRTRDDAARRRHRRAVRHARSPGARRSRAPRRLEKE